MSFAEIDAAVADGTLPPSVATLGTTGDIDDLRRQARELAQRLISTEANDGRTSK